MSKPRVQQHLTFFVSLHLLFLAPVLPTRFSCEQRFDHNVLLCHAMLEHSCADGLQAEACKLNLPCHCFHHLPFHSNPLAPPVKAEIWLRQHARSCVHRQQSWPWGCSEWWSHLQHSMEVFAANVKQSRIRICCMSCLS